MTLKFRKVFISEERFESAGAFDVNNNGIIDIVSGAYWYEGPDFIKKHPIGDIKVIGEYYDDFCTIPMDINGNGRLDFVVGGWWSDHLRWRENPGETGKEWPEHNIAPCTSIETTRAWDVDGDGQLEIVSNCPNGPLVVYKLITDAGGKGTGKFTAHEIFAGPQGHGLGFGDITGNGRGDFILKKGWLEAPEDTFGGEWIFHEEFDLASASVPIIVADINGDGLAELIVGQSHAYGLDWWQQEVGSSGNRTWHKHAIDPFNSQYHDMRWVDIDGDGECELVTGKRYRAHCGKDPGSNDNVGSYYFKWTGEGFAKQIVDFGPRGSGSGLGIYFDLADLTGNGLLDIIAPGKDGLYVFENLGLSS